MTGAIIESESGIESVAGGSSSFLVYVFPIPSVNLVALIQFSCSLPPVDTLSSSVLHFILLQVFVHLSSCILDTTLIGLVFDQVAPPAYPYSIWLFVFVSRSIPSRSILFGPVSSWSYVFCYFVVDSFRTGCFLYLYDFDLCTPVTD